MDEEVDDEELADEVRAGIAASTTPGDPTERDPCCWLRLEQVAADVGCPARSRRHATDLVVRLLAAHEVRRETLRPLAARDERRGTLRPLGEDARAEARAALQSIQAELRRVHA